MFLRFFLIVCLTAMLAAAPTVPAGFHSVSRSISDSPSKWNGWNAPAFSAMPDGAKLPHPTTTAIVQDSRGFIWVGTRGGLARYDGQRVVAFKQEPDRPGSLSDNYVRSLLALPDGSVLVGTNVGGLLRFDPTTNRFLRIGAGDPDFADRIMSLATDHRGGAWVASYSGVFHVSPKSGKTKLVWGGSGDATGAFAVHQDLDGTLWIGSANGLLVRRPGAKRAVRVNAGGPASGILRESDIWAITRDDRGRLWVGTESQGVVRLSGDNAVQPRGLEASSPFVSHRTIRKFAPDPAGGMLVATDGIGVIIVSDDDRDPIALRNDPQQRTSIPGDTVRDLFVDRSGGLWVATDFGPARRIASQRSVFTIASGMPDPAKSLTSNDVRGLMIDQAGRIWVGLENGNIDVLDRDRGTVRRIALGGYHVGQDVKALTQARSGTVFVGARGVVAVDPDSGNWRSLDIPEVNGTSIISLAAVEDLLLIGTYKGLFVLDQRTGAVTHYRQDKDQKEGIPNDEIINITKLDDEVWLSTSRGISRFDPELGRFENFSNIPDDPTSLPQDYTNSILYSGGRLWVGTFGGAAYANPRSLPLRFKVFTEANGLAGNDVSSLVADKNGRIWAASSRGLSVIDPRTGKIASASFADGLPETTFTRRTVIAMDDGSLLFGGTAGLTVVQPRSLPATGPKVAELTPTTLHIDGKSLPFAALWQDHLPRIKAKSRGFRLGFALLDFAAPGEVIYSYRLQGFDEDWISVPADTPALAAYTNLPGGDYTLLLRAEVPGLEQQVFEREIKLEVAPLWYQTWWAYAGMAVTGLLAVFALIHVRTRVMRHQARSLERTIAERTSELRAANDELERLATTDGLTGLLNRRSMMAELESEHSRAQRNGLSFCLILIDIDNFKSINDRYGHAIGDRVLKNVAQVMAGEVRQADRLARFGGEEFVVLLPDCDTEKSLITAERLRDAVARAPVEIEGGELTVTVSIGVTVWKEPESVTTTLNRADKAMYAAKSDGRNAVRFATVDDPIAVEV